MIKEFSTAVRVRRFSRTQARAAVGNSIAICTLRGVLSNAACIGEESRRSAHEDLPRAVLPRISLSGCIRIDASVAVDTLRLPRSRVTLAARWMAQQLTHSAVQLARFIRRHLHEVRACRIRVVLRTVPRAAAVVAVALARNSWRVVRYADICATLQKTRCAEPIISLGAGLGFLRRKVASGADSNDCTTLPVHAAGCDNNG